MHRKGPSPIFLPDLLLNKKKGVICVFVEVLQHKSDLPAVLQPMHLLSILFKTKLVLLVEAEGTVLPLLPIQT